jgi:anti-sigma B factor antagonist
VRGSALSQNGSGPAVDEEFRVDVVPERNAVRVRPVGEIDLSTVGEIRSQLGDLHDAGFRRVILDLRATTFLDSTGLRLCLDFQAASAADGTEFAIVPGPPAVQRAFQVAGLTAWLPFQRNGAAWA